MRKILTKTGIRKKGEPFLIALNKYLSFLKECERKLKGSDSLSLQKFLIQASSNLMSIVYGRENEWTGSLKEKNRALFRKIVGKYIFQSKMMKRFYEKPRGYPGDYLMFEMIYDYKPISGGLGKMFDNYVLNYPFVIDAINRKNLIKDILKQEIQKLGSKEFRILDIGCGSSREIAELLKENPLLLKDKKISIVLIDQDSDALQFSGSRICSYLSPQNSLDSLNMNMLEILGFKKTKLSSKLKRSSFDLVYSIGVVDYFLDNLFERFVDICLNLVKKDGKLIIASCSSKNQEIYTPLKWFTDWNFYSRDTKSMKKILKRIGIKKFSFKWTNLNHFFFLEINK